jgi:RNA ligase (TIGR02306 family)
MSEWKPSIVRIEQIQPHPGADLLDIYIAGGYPVVDKKGRYAIGDLAVYLPLDTVVPATVEQFAFLEGKRLRAKKIRGVYSQGLLSEVPDGSTEGDSVVELYGCKKYVYPEEYSDLIGLPEQEKKHLYFPKQDNKNQYQVATMRSDFASPPKHFSIPYYDLEGLRKYVRCFQEGEEVVISEKIDGCNASFVHDGAEFWVKSRNYYKKANLDCLYYGTGIRYELDKKLATKPNLVVMGEIYGQVKPFRYDATLDGNKLISKFRVFDVYDLMGNRFLAFDEVAAFCQELGLDMAPVLYRGPWKEDLSLYALAEQDTALSRSIPDATKVSEGFVIRPVVEGFCKAGRKIFKLKSERYNLLK